MNQSTRFMITAAVFAGLAPIACGDDDPPSQPVLETPPIVVTVRPGSARVLHDQSLQLTATVTGAADSGVTWSIDGDASSGSISDAGLFTAPSVLPTPPTVTIRATSVADSTLSGCASVTIGVEFPLIGEMARAPAGTFLMGTSGYQEERQHAVTLTRAFYVSDHEVTQAEWRQVMGWISGSVTGDRYPVEVATWYDALEFCNKLSESEGWTPVYEIASVKRLGNNIISAAVAWDRDGNGYRLPTEAEWEYACRAGSSTAFAWGDPLGGECNPIDFVLAYSGWYCGNTFDRFGPREVRRKAPNFWGLYDTHGNVPEWCWDFQAPYPDGAVTDPAGPDSGFARTSRGGSWSDDATYCRSAARGRDPVYGGFRPVRTDFGPLNQRWHRSRRPPP